MKKLRFDELKELKITKIEINKEPEFTPTSACHPNLLFLHYN